MLKFSKTNSLLGLKKLLDGFRLDNECFVIKPNFYKEFIGYYTEKEVLELFFMLLEGRKIYVTECYTAARNDLSKKILPGLEEGMQHVEWFRLQDEIFFKSTGIGELFKKHNVEWINATEEYWAGRTVDPEIIKALVEKKYPPVKHPELYGVIPKKLFDLRAATLVNLAKFKVMYAKSDRIFFTLAMKNLFGMIPAPNRENYHGKDDMGLSSSINDMLKIYTAVFPDNIHVLEAMNRTIISVNSLTQAGYKHSNPALVEDLGFALAGDNPVEMDAYAVSLFGIDPHKRHFLRMGKESFGEWDENKFPQTPEKIKNYFDKFKM
ncbi:MAG: hypothetical protein A2297_05770 [Elusimicrobia bacterium RIFOXYB2_FULL_48_7]|nr:MAG: hypothetical protein A2297_05770 [Elusimicrobia bacterium RIFOXYB2_FULL_48_7]